MSIRYTLMEIMDESTEDIIYDPTTLDVSNFKFTNGYYLHTMSRADIRKPYIVSQTYYGTVAYENLILLINKIGDIWELPVGTKIRIPKLQDIKTFVKDNRV